MDALRVPWFLAWGAAGLWYAADYLTKHPWHHATILWVVPMALGLYGLVRAYQALFALLVVRAWLREDDETARAGLADVQPYARALPPRIRSAYLERRQALRTPRPPTSAGKAHTARPPSRGRC